MKEGHSVTDKKRKNTERKEEPRCELTDAIKTLGK